jgi:hypothetical protein
MSTTPTTPKARPTGAAKKTAAAKADAAPTKEAQGKLLAEARTEAIGQLLDENRERFNELMEAAAAKRNVTWKRRPTEAEKREAKLKALLEEDPTLADLAKKIREEQLAAEFDAAVATS